MSHYNIRPTVNIYATTQGRDLGGVAADIQKIVDESRAELPRGSTISIRGQAVTMSTAYQQLLIGLAMSIVLIYLLIVVNFPVLARSVRHHHGVAARARGASPGCCSSPIPACRCPR